MSSDFQELIHEGVELQNAFAKADLAGRSALVGTDPKELVTMEFSQTEDGLRVFERIRVASSWKSRGVMEVGLALIEAQTDLMRKHYTAYGEAMEAAQKSIAGRSAFVKPTARLQQTRQLQRIDAQAVDRGLEDFLTAHDSYRKALATDPAPSVPIINEVEGIGARGKVRVHADASGRISKVEIDEDWAESQSNVSLGAALTEACKDAGNRSRSIEMTRTEWDDVTEQFGRAGAALDHLTRRAGI